MKWLLIVNFWLLGCQTSSGWMMPETDGKSRAPAAAYAADGMTFRKVMPHQNDPKPWEFYYKHCSVNGNEAFYSKTSYDCSGVLY